MKKRYQKGAPGALERYKQKLGSAAASVQLVLPLAEVVGWAQQSVGELMRESFRRLMQLVMEDEVMQLSGARHRVNAERQVYRWGSEKGFVVIDGQKVPLRRPRVRDKLKREVSLGSYELFQRGSLLEEEVWKRILHGLTTRRYEQVVQQFSEAYGLKKSAISKQFRTASRHKLDELLTRPLDKLRLCAILIDGTVFRGQNLIVALGVGCDGRKHVLGLRQGATENATVVGSLLSDLAERGVAFDVPRLYILDGSKALRKALRGHAGEAALVQRCQVHKVHNVTAHLTDQYRPAIAYKLRRAYRMKHYGDAKQALQQLLRELMDLNPDAARSLEEGLEETLTVHRLAIADPLRRSLATTNIIESTFSTVGTVCRNVKRWSGGDQRLRWVASGLLFAESRWNRLHGYRQIPELLHALQQTHPHALASNTKAA